MLALGPYRAAVEAIAPVAMPPDHCLAIALDKSATVASIGSVSTEFAVPATIAPASAEEAAEAWTGRFPVIVKPRVGTGSEEIRVARDPSELHHVFTTVHRQYPKPLVQEQIQYLPGEKFVLLYLFDHQGTLRSWYGQQVILERRSLRVGIRAGWERGGVSLLWRSHQDQVLLERGGTMLKALNWSGLAALECARDRRDGEYYLFEINARLDGTSTLALRHGPNFAYNSCLVALRQIPHTALEFPVGARCVQRAIYDAGRSGMRSALRLCGSTRCAPGSHAGRSRSPAGGGYATARKAAPAPVSACVILSCGLPRLPAWTEEAMMPADLVGPLQREGLETRCKFANERVSLRFTTLGQISCERWFDARRKACWACSNGDYRQDCRTGAQRQRGNSGGDPDLRAQEGCHLRLTSHRANRYGDNLSIVQHRGEPAQRSVQRTVRWDYHAFLEIAVFHANADVPKIMKSET